MVPWYCSIMDPSCVYYNPIPITQSITHVATISTILLSHFVKSIWAGEPEACQSNQAHQSTGLYAMLHY